MLYIIFNSQDNVSLYMAKEGILMAMRGTSLKPSAVTKTLICVDEFNGIELSGRLYNMYIMGAVGFQSIFSMIWILEDFFDGISFPKPYYQDRAFTDKMPEAKKTDIGESGVRQYMTEDIFNEERGKKATFVIQVQFRQNATWQGTITWADEKKTQRFRSALEMVKLMDNALGGLDNGGSLLNSNWD